MGLSADGRGGFVKFMRDSTEHKLTEDQLYAATVAIGEGVGRKLGKAQAPIRVAVSTRCCASSTTSAE